jgi:hypothetical protein
MMDTTERATRHGGMAVQEARYYPPETEVGPDGQGGIVDPAVSEVRATADVNDGLVTLSFAGYRDAEPLSYEFDCTPDTARGLARQLLEAVGGTGPR